MAWDPLHEANASARLHIVHSPAANLNGTSVSLADGLLVVGRDVDGGLSIPDQALSRTHFRIVSDTRNGVDRLADAGSRNGTRVGGRAVESVALTPGAVIRAGDTLCVYTTGHEMAAALAKVDAIAASNASVLILGETGVGKELLARRIHDHSGRSGRFVAVNCAALPRELASAELFGHRRGAFSGANVAREGLFVHADAGTLLLDEVGDLPRDLQPTLLRVLQERTLRPLGSDSEVTIDVRVLAATLFDLSKEIAAGRFRADLHARLAETIIRVPPLRERRTEILALAAEFALELGATLAVTVNAAEALLLWHWPYNVRELRSLIRSFVQRSTAGTPLDLAYLRDERSELTAALSAEPAPENVDGSGARPDRAELEGLLVQHEGNVSAVAQALGKPRTQVYRWLRSLGISAARFRRASGPK